MTGQGIHAELLGKVILNICFNHLSQIATIAGNSIFREHHIFHSTLNCGNHVDKPGGEGQMGKYGTLGVPHLLLRAAGQTVGNHPEHRTQCVFKGALSASHGIPFGQQFFQFPAERCTVAVAGQSFDNIHLLHGQQCIVAAGFLRTLLQPENRPRPNPLLLQQKPAALLPNGKEVFLRHPSMGRAKVDGMAV